MKPTLIDDFLGEDVRKNKIVSNKQLLEYCQEEPNIHFVDISTPMFKPDGNLRSDIFLSDGLHMNALGYTIWNPIVRKVIADLRR